MQHLLIQLNGSEDYMPLHCPKCGAQQDPESSTYCQHVTFVYLPRYDFEYVAPDFQNTVALILNKAAESDDSDVEDLLLDLPSTGTNFVVEVLSSGISCGPSSFRVLYGFELDDLE
jgi:hypothetical protein